MGLQKAEILAQAMESHAAELEEQLEAAEKRVHAAAGAQKAVKSVASDIAEFIKITAAEILAKDSEIEVPGSREELVLFAKRLILRCHGAAVAQADHVVVAGSIAQGRVAGLRSALEAAQGKAKAERGKIAALEELGVDETGNLPPDNVVDFNKHRPRPPGVAPGPSIAQRAKAEEAAAKADAEEEGEKAPTPRRKRARKTAKKKAGTSKPRTRKRRKKAEEAPAGDG